jgi:hypothetical protein
VRHDAVEGDELVDELQPNGPSDERFIDQLSIFVAGGGRRKFRAVK